MTRVVIAFLAVMALSGCRTPLPVRLDEVCGSDWKCLYDAGVRAYQQYRHADADKYYRAALAVAERATPPDYRVAVTLNDLGLNYHYQDRHVEAEHFLKRALEAWERAEGPEHQGTSTTLNNLGESYRVQRKYADADGYLRRALTLREKLLPSDHVEIAITLRNLGGLADDQQMDREAEVLYVKALAMSQRIRADALSAELLYNLGLLRERQGKNEDALVFLRGSVELRHALFSRIPGHPELSRTCSALKRLLEATGGVAPERALCAR